MKHIRFLCFLLAVSMLLSVSAFAEGTQENVKVKKLTIEKEPDKTVYEAGEMFDPSGIIINATMSDGSVQENVDYTCKQKKALTAKDQAVTFTFGGKSVIQKITVKNRGNNDLYSVANTPALENSVLTGKIIFWLGSSVTYGYGSEGESMVEFIDKRNGTVSIKEAVSGTTLADIDDPKKGDSYVKRLEAYLNRTDAADSIDIFVCQLSTNDMYDSDHFGAVTAKDVTDRASFDRATTFGAMEYIISLVRDKWDCPIFFYTNAKMDNAGYSKMISALYEISEKWEIGVIDLFTDENFNAISSEDYALFMTDNVHPTKAGYRDWWLPKFEQAFYALFE